MHNGHAPGHIRETFAEAIDAFAGWSPGEPLPTVTREIYYVPHEISLAEACGLVWNCTDILPGVAVTLLRDDCGLSLQRRTYAAAARAMLAALKETGATRAGTLPESA